MSKLTKNILVMKFSGINLSGMRKGEVGKDGGIQGESLQVRNSPEFALEIHVQMTNVNSFKFEC